MRFSHVNQPLPLPVLIKTEQLSLLGLVFIVEIRLLHLLDGVGDLALGGGDRYLLACTVAQQSLAQG